MLEIKITDLSDHEWIMSNVFELKRMAHSGYVLTIVNWMQYKKATPIYTQSGPLYRCTWTRPDFLDFGSHSGNYQM